MNKIIHTPVLLNETINLLNIKPNGIYVDCTAGYGGHSQEILNKINNNGKLICIDKDINSIDYLKNKFNNKKNVSIYKSDFIDIKDVLNKENIEYVDGIIADLGVSSLMLDDIERGFSYHNSSKLDMRMDQEKKFSAYDVINKYTAQQLINIFKKYGEIKNPAKVVKSIINKRKTTNIETTDELVKIIKENSNWSDLKKTKHPAKVYFQAIRIEVNNELDNLKLFISRSIKLLNNNGVLAIISFHSLEDKIVKDEFLNLTTSNVPKEVPDLKKCEFILLTKKPIIPTQKEIEDNKRSHSAKLRGVMKI